MQWYNFIIEQFGDGIRDKIGIVGGLKDNERRELRLPIGFEANIKRDIVIGTFQTMIKNRDILGQERFGLLIIDETHRAPANQFKKVTNCVRAASRLGLTATLNRPDQKSPMMKGLIGDVVYKIGIKDLILKGFIVEPKFYAHIIEDPKAQKEIKNCILEGFPKSTFIKKTSASSKVKFDYINRLSKQLAYEGKKTLVYTDFVNSEEEDDIEYLFDTGVNVRDDFVLAFSELGINVAGIDAKMTSLQRQNVFNDLANGKLDTIVFGSLGSEGINIPKVDTVIHCNATASNIRYAQRNGRAMRKYPGKDHCDIYEILLNTPKEFAWSRENFLEYESELFFKQKVYIK